MFEVGRIYLKIAGRDAGREAVIVDILDEKFVLVDGNVRRRKCNILHLEPTSKVIQLKKKASHGEVVEAFKKIDLNIWNTKPKKPAERPKKQRRKKKVPEPKKKQKKGVKEAKKVEKPVKKEPVKKSALKGENRSAIVKDIKK